MRFALLGTHPDGIDMACALVETGRHQLVAYTSAEPVPDHILRRWGEQAHPTIVPSNSAAPCNRNVMSCASIHPTPCRTVLTKRR